MELLLGEVGVLHDLEAHVIEALEGADTGGADGDGLPAMLDEFADGVATHADVFGMHLVTFDFLALDGLESAGTDVQRQFLALYTVGIEIGEHLGGEMESCRGSGHRTLDLGIDGLIGGLVALLGLAVQIWRDGELAHGIDNLSEGKFRV